MVIKKEIKGNNAVFKLEGRLDTSTSDELDREAKSLSNSINDILFDFKDLEYVSSSGLRVILAIQKMINARNGNMAIINANKVVKDVFDITGFSAFIKIN